MGHDHSHHDHSHEHSHGHDHAHSHFDHLKGAVPSALMKAMWITVAFMLLEFVGGIFANSLALLSDSAHMLTDVGSLCLALFIHWFARRPFTPRMSFGYHRVEILGALLSGLIIWLLSGLLIFEAIRRFSNPPEVQAPLMIGIAFLGLLANVASMRVLHSVEEKNLNLRAAYLHLLADCLGSLGAVVAGVLIWWTGYRLIDPIVSILFAVLMLVSSWKLVREAVEILMESVPSSIDPEQVQQDLKAIEGVSEVHDLHIWTVSSGRHALSVHLVSSRGDAVLNDANSLLKSKYEIEHTTIQVEHPERFQSERCYDCATPKSVVTP